MAANNSCLSSLPCQTIFLIKIYPVQWRQLLSFANASCHLSALTGPVAGGLVAIRWWPATLWWEEIGCNAEVCGEGVSVRGEGAQGASCQEVWHQGQGWHLESTQLMVMIREHSGVQGCFFTSCSSTVQLTLLKVKQTPDLWLNLHNKHSHLISGKALTFLYVFLSQCVLDWTLYSFYNVR